MPLFGKKKTPEQVMREQQRELNRTERSLQRDRAKLEQQEKQLETQIKRAAEKGDKVQAQALAKQLVRVRQQRTKSYAASSKLADIGAHASTAQANMKLTTAMAGATQATKAVNKQMDPAKVQRTMMEFEQQNQQMEMTAEMMDDTINGVMEDDEEESEEIMNQVLDEIGVELNTQLVDAPRNKVKQEEEEEEFDAELMARLTGLRVE